MDMNLSVEVPNHEESSDVRESAMGGKLQRNLSLSAKWASDKAMAIEYLRRQREIMTWIESVLKRELPTTDLFEALKSGVVLREMMETLFPDVSNCMSPISRNYSKRMAPWKERENISVFLRQCKSIGMYDLSLFCTDDLYEGTNMVQVLFCVQHFMMFSEEHAGHLFKPVPKNEPAEFSNQELEMAMAKIEQAGVDVSALKGLISVGASAVPERAAIPEKKDTVRTASSPTPVSPMEKILVRVQEEEPAESEECPEEKKVEIEESGSDAGDDEAVTELEDTSVPVQEIYAVEVPVPTSELPTAEDEETTAVIQQVLSDLTTAIEEDESEAQMKTTQEVLVVQAEPEAPTVQDISIPDEVEELLTIPAEDLVVEVKAEPVEQTEVKIEVAEVVEARDVDLADTPAESTTVEEVVIAQPSVAATEKEAGSPIEDEELEAKAMAKCTCGRCTIM
ncbi:hypothetical protein PF005_g8406 [Phytophthora fragariae]|uniref:Calponin-homology (CH) domain-containing protein n=1 Tax=Phytophthora fragariae TaxID=53985 RepID=A0A6A3LH48_9STRA|nr:hypothetical protein PF009_g9556 [Phytophthora fragariae]KAE9015153.1 hypothetical protein PF011_g7747 [Phytophthora fragariae]KAE9116021.1 hypothetical protein PF007_g9819 [Phytophthora fragariae]KAE9145319.1 hypothetical protein PF006_g9819 [Phytophthora fragariae]KAE9218076.1 hypothetical protein PF005_g8406 [Phytophthora fragariae]